MQDDVRPSEILPGRLFLGSAKHARAAGLGENAQGITHLLNVCDAVVVLPGKTASGVVAEWVPIKDDGSDDLFGQAQTEQELEAALAADPAAPVRGAWWRCRAFLEEALGASGGDSRVLVHCALGVNRSATIVVAWLMESRRWSVAEAMDFVQERRWQVNPAPLHLQQLEAFQQDHLGMPPSAPRRRGPGRCVLS